VIQLPIAVTTQTYW